MQYGDTALIYPLVCILGSIAYFVRCERIIKRSYSQNAILQVGKIMVTLSDGNTSIDITTTAKYKSRELQELANKYNVTLLFNSNGESEAIIHKNTIILSTELLAEMIPVKNKLLYPAHKAIFFHELGHLKTNRLIQFWATTILSLTIPFSAFLRVPNAYIFSVLFLLILISRYKEKCADLYMIDAIKDDPISLRAWANHLRFISENNLQSWLGSWLGSWLDFIHPSIRTRIGYLERN